MNDPLLEPFQLKHLKIRNRVFTSAHEPAYSVEGMPTDRYRLYHEERAKGGVGLTMTAGSAVVAEDSAPVFGNLHAYDDAIVPWIQRLTDGVHEHGAACMIQLTHLGRRSIWSHDNWLPVVAPTSLREPAHRAIPKEAEDWDIERIIRKFADAAERMQAGGMDGIEIESYGHLFDQFYSPTTNFREDEFGGSLENRLRFSTRVLEAMRERVGPEFILGLRMSIDEVVPEGLDYNAGIEILKEFEATGLIDFVNVIRGLVATDAQLSNVIPIHGMPAAPHLDFAGLVKENTGLAVLHASKIDDVATARYAIQEGKVDLVGMTRAHMADPHIVLKVIEEREEQIRPCVGATFCLDGIYENGEALCVHNAATGREAIMPHKVLPAEKHRKIIVIGAGPAGLEAARVAGERGHEVTVFEAMPKAGGQIALTVRNKRRQDFQGVVDWRLAELDRLGVEIIYDHIAEQEDISALNPDVVIVATGGLPQMPPLEKGAELAVTSWDVLSGEVIPQGNVLLYDDNGTHSALSTAEIIAQSGADLEIVTPERTLGVEIGGVNHVPYARTFNETETRVTLNQRVMSASKENDRLVVELGSDHSSHRSTREVDYLVVDHGTLPNADLYLELKSLSCNQGEIDHNALLNGQPQPCFEDEQESFALYRIGDAVANRNIHAAIYDALRLMKDI
ncbi:MAG: NADH:flavin oxidoreductase [Actinomycetota bacterium]|jgi:2,4-dienoyl-CoA reductase-like NADH-dependent reductase (Old Yellow Enzyme family)/thioredoxin reductase|nr:NADH:flavin oxidoreductase [Actinomycetota bacterium]